MSNVIPQPATLPVIGNLLDLDAAGPIQSLTRLAAEHGPIFRITILGQHTLFLTSQELVNEVSDETRFSKRLHSALVELRAVIGDGLFTAYNEEANWTLAHKLLMPAFGPLGLRNMFSKMLEMAEQMLLRWERFGDAPIDVADTMTRLTLDTLALCAFDYRFNSFYQEGEHPFVAAMLGALAEAQARDRRPSFVSNAMVKTKQRFAANVDYMREVADRVLAARQAETTPSMRGDLMDVMLSGVDGATGETLSVENIRYQLVTFLIAGHETTSGLLSFAIHLLLQNPEVLARARESVDAALGGDTPAFEDLSRLRFVEQILMETLRLWPTAPGFAVTPNAPTTLAGVYPVKPGDELLVLLPSLHRDPKVWHEPEVFRPDRFAPENAERIPPNAWKPFGSGRRACIGRGFAMQEAQLVLAMVLQRFDLEMADPAYKLQVSETLTMKPRGLLIRARRRALKDAPRSDRPAVPANGSAPVQRRPPPPTKPLLVLHGGNAGTSEAFARRIAADAGEHGFSVSLQPMDNHAGDLPKEGAIVVVTSSYEGQPPDNARRFVTWAEGLEPDVLDGVKYAVFGCGNRQWARTYQAVPKRVDAALAAAGAARIRPRGETDASGDFFGGFETWLAGLWMALAGALGQKDVTAAPPKDPVVEVVTGARERALNLLDLRKATILDNRELVDMTSPLGRSKRHIEVRLPDGMSYRAGDYLAVLTSNLQEVVQRALRCFKLHAEDELVIADAGSLNLRRDRPVTAAEVFAHHVELGMPAGQAMISRLAEETSCPPERQALARLAGPEVYEAEILSRRVSLLDLLERYPACELSLGAFLAALPVMRARQYSISSSPLLDPSRCSLTVALLDTPARDTARRYRGVASTYLSALTPGAAVSVAVRPGPARFRLPSPETPIVMICAGSGVAPFRGFIGERAILKRSGQTVGGALLFFGCDAPDVDFLYREELEGWQAEGVVDVRTAFSEVNDPIRFVQHRVWQDRADIVAFTRAGARFFICGEGRFMAPAVKATLARIAAAHLSLDEPRSAHLLSFAERSGRVTFDVFA